LSTGLPRSGAAHTSSLDRFSATLLGTGLHADARAVAPAIFDLGQLRYAAHAAFFDDERGNAIRPVGRGPPVAAALVKVPQKSRGEDVAGPGRVELLGRLERRRVVRLLALAIDVRTTIAERHHQHFRLDAHSAITPRSGTSSSEITTTSALGRTL